MCRTNTCPWTDSIMRKVRLSKIKGDVCTCDLTTCDCVRLHRVLKKWWRSLRVCSTQTSPYMPNLTTTRWRVVTLRLRLIYTEKGTLVTYWIGSWTPETVWIFGQKKISFFHGDAIFVSPVVRPVTLSLERRRYQCPYHCLYMWNQATWGLSGYRARRRVADSRRPVRMAGLSLN
jgi:hypothetical protein